MVQIYWYLLCLLLFTTATALLIMGLVQRSKIIHTELAINGMPFPKEKKARNKKSKKTKEQMELELLLIRHSPTLVFLAKLDKNIRIKLALTVAIFLMIFIVLPPLDFYFTSLTFFIVYMAVVILPNILISQILNKKIKLLLEELPGFIDLVAVCVQTGMTINQSLVRVGEDFKGLNSDLSFIMLRVMQRAEITSLTQALSELSLALPSKEIRLFCTVLQQSLHFGSSVYEQLIHLSADIREMQLLRLEEKMGMLSAKMSLPLIVFIMFPIVILILAPGAMRILPEFM
ncbi:hypothetical protein A6A19_08610 [Actinobacillus delphinicola]|uniref:Flp pilus assembly protein n=1 Tax=Actinobacillus delphinicola TaxID=51161 RepID=A0A448TVE3_9PAST|nr:type II secretion system F family protein [Actinobacillus delphinicola]MDG6898036.1 hypothetical protein [Actinobacillus delphinicola]VEJ09902.1 Flp pilus assembly protein [Actinobacillus delphinicola]